MARNKSKKKQKSSKRVDYNYAVPGNIRNTVGSVSATTLANQVEGLTNPWSEHARGSKVPDDDAAASVPFTISYPKTFTTNAAGYGVTFVSPELDSVFESASAIVGGTQTVTTFAAGVPVANLADYQAAFHRYRFVSWGVRVYSTLAPTDQQGSYKIITMPENPVNGWSWAGGLFEDTVSLPLSEKNIHWISKPIGVNYKEYSTLTDSLFWTRCVVIVEGAPASVDAYTIELVMHCEGQINIGSVVSTMATPAADSNPAAVAAVAKTRAHHGKTHHKPGFMGVIRGFALNALRDSAAAMIPFVGPTVSRYLGNQSQLTLGN